MQLHKQVQICDEFLTFCLLHAKRRELSDGKLITCETKFVTSMLSLVTVPIQQITTGYAMPAFYNMLAEQPNRKLCTTPKEIDFKPYICTYVHIWLRAYVLCMRVIDFFLWLNLCFPVHTF